MELTILVLCCFSFLAGFIDAIVGGGGLLQLPALLVALPGTAVPTVLGTNKMASIAGTSMAAWRYGRHVSIDWHIIAPAAVVAFGFSYLGSLCISYLNPALLRPVTLALLIFVAIYIALMKTTGLVHAPRHARIRARWIAAVVGAVIGFYDGFFGPGTGSFLIFIFVGIFGFDFLCASASAKVINVGTNLASVIYFASADHIRYRIAIPMAVCNVLGSLVGSRLAILKGSRFVRVFFLGVVALLIAKLGWDQLRG
jgi:uncharacterized membrane protein YfcA